jgi:hypothetical protein
LTPPNSLLRQWTRGVRSRYKKEIAELTDLGFEYLCSEGQHFPLSRFFRVVPALVSFGIWLQGVPVWIKAGSILFGYAILCWRRKPSFVELDGSHAKFISTFEDGSMLVSSNYDYPIPPTANILRQFKAATLAETWHAHRTRVDALESLGKEITLEATTVSTPRLRPSTGPPDRTLPS